MFLRDIWIPVTIFLVVSCVVCLGFRSETEAETISASPLVATEKLIRTENYYEAILALQPLLMSDTKSKEQEEALWLAHTLLVKWEKEIIKNGAFGKDTHQKIGILNKLGADFDNVEINFGYRYGFLHRLIDAYPDTPKQPIIEYALIQSGYPVPQDFDASLSALHDYIKKYEKTGRAEVYKAYLDIAHIHHGIWAVLTFPDHPYVAMFDTFGTGDPEKDKKLADSHREIALKYYAKFYINPHGLIDSFDYGFYDFNDENGFQLLKRNAEFGWNFILYGC
ncbi:MAG: hypothetical protein OXI67_06325 [Candidatus Poribacteria bacterium]|nr:hypothetical protein [Candidatus Poribacteria bacterium]